MNNVIKRTWNQGSMVTIEDLLGMTFQAESGGHTFVISAIDADGNAVSLSGTPAGTMLRPDDTDQALTCSVSGGKVYATLPAGCYDVPGRAGITIFLTSDGQKTAIYAAVVSISRTQSGTVAPGTTASVVDLINAINAAIAGIPATDTALKAAMAPTYSNTGLYAVGSYAWYNGVLKRCIVPITTAESYTAAHWTDAALGNDLRDLKSALKSADEIVVDADSNVESQFFEIHPPLVLGYSLNGGAINPSDNKRAVSKVFMPSGDKMKITVQAGYKVEIDFYSSEDESSYVDKTGWITTDSNITIMGKFFRIIVGGDSSIEDVYNSIAGVFIQTKTGGVIRNNIALIGDTIITESGGIKDSDGKTKFNNVGRRRTLSSIATKNIKTIEIPSGYEAYIYQLNANGGLIAPISWQKGIFDTTLLNTNTFYVNIVFRDASNTSRDISNENIVAVIHRSGIDDVARDYIGKLTNPNKELPLNLSLNIGHTFNGGVYNTAGYNRAASSIFYRTYSFIRVEVLNGYKVELEYYSKPDENAYINNSSWITKTSTIEPKGKYFRVLVGGDSSILDVYNNIAKVFVYVDPSIINERNPEAVETLMIARKKKNEQSKFLRNKCCILHVSDTHEDVIRWENLIYSAEEILPDAIIHTGDLTAMDGNDSINYIYDRLPSMPLLVAIGNHDVGCGGTNDQGHGSPIGNGGLTNAQAFTKYIQPLVSQYGITANKTYYYHDINGVRFIVVNDYDYDVNDGTDFESRSYILSQDQVDWFISVLEDSITNNIPVVVCAHEGDIILSGSNGVGNFNQTYPLISGTWKRWSGHPLCDIIDAFISGSSLTQTYDQTSTIAPNAPTLTVDCSFASSGHFVCWLLGHRHSDQFGYIGLQNQAAITVTCDFCSIRSLMNYGCLDSDLARFETTKTEDAFNYVVIDKTEKRITLVRFGATKYITENGVGVRDTYSFTYN